MTTKITPKKKAKVFWIACDGSKRNILGFPKYISMHKNKRDALRITGIATRVLVYGDVPCQKL